MAALLFLLAGVAFVVIYFMSDRVLNLAVAALFFAAATLQALAARRVPPN